jgi:hypothetical protein
MQVPDVSLLVLVFFLYRLIPPEFSEGVFNDYVGIVIVLYILIISSWTIHLFSKLEDTSVLDINIMGGIALALSCIAIIIYGGKIFLAHKYKAQNLSFKSITQAMKKNKQAPKSQ